MLRPAALEAAVEDALRREEDRFALVARRLGQADLRGRGGAHALAQLVNGRDPAQAAAESTPEVLLERLMIAAGLPPPVRQFTLARDGRTYRVDLSYPEL
ncbi:MAG TPA: hypothetical protein VFW71_08145, partial [Actinomycetota bacterium]|nr:hypothetical protein [Actinomycetota bacterium]